MDHCEICGRGPLNSNFRCRNCNLWACRNCFDLKDKACFKCLFDVEAE